MAGTNKVIYGNQTIMDISDSTTEASNLLQGEVGYSGNGDRVVGTYVDNNNRRSFYGTCTDSASTVAKKVTLANTDGWELVPGTTVSVKFSNSNTATGVTLNINGTGAKKIWYNNSCYTDGTGTSTTVYGTANRIITYVYDGTYWVWLSQGADNNTTYSTMAANEVYTGTETTAKLARADRLKTDINNLIDDKIVNNLPKIQNANTTDNIAICYGNGTYSYFKIASLVISGTNQNKGAVVFEISQRRYPLSRLQIGVTGPSTAYAIQYFTTDYDNHYWINQVDNTHWDIYGAYNEKWGSACLHRITGTQVNRDVAITVVMQSVEDIDTSTMTQVEYGGNAGYATSAGNASTVGGKVITDTYSGTSTNGMSGKAVKAAIDAIQISESQVTNLTTDLGNKVDKVSGKGLSTNDYTTTEKNKLAGIASGAEVNIQPDWNVTDTSSDAFIKNKPTIPDISTKVSKSGDSMTGNLVISRGKGLRTTDKGNTEYTLIEDNGTNLWIGSTAGAGTHHTGNTYISTGLSSTDANASGYPTAYLTIPTKTTNASTGVVTYSGVHKAIAHSGNVETGDSDGQVKIAGVNVNVKGLDTGAYAPAYSLPAASSTTRGGIKIGYSESDKNYALKLSSEKAYVTVPWTDTDKRKAFFGTTTTAAATATKVVTLNNTDGWELKDGVVVGVYFNTDANNTATSVKLNVNGSGAKSVSQTGNSAYTSTNANITGRKGYTTYYMYNGTYWCFLNASYNVNTDTDTKVTQTRTPVDESVSNGFYPVLFSNSASTATATETARKADKVGVRLAYVPGGLQRAMLDSEYVSTEHIFTHMGTSNAWEAIYIGSQTMIIASSPEDDFRLFFGVSGAGGSNPMWALCPYTDNNLNLGAVGKRWKQVYAASSTISTSDRNEKKDILPLDESAKDLIMALNPVSYKFINGDTGRIHYGMISQDIEETLSDLGMTAMDFAGFCKDEKEDKSGYIYGLRYEEFIAPLIKTVQMQQQEIEELKRRIDILEGGQNS